MSSEQRSGVEPTPQQEEAIWQGLLETERFWEERGVDWKGHSPQEVRDRANRIAHVGHADFLMDVVRRRGGGVQRRGNWAAVSSTPFCSEPGYESYRAVD